MRENKIKAMVKAMVKEAIEEDRKAHNKIQINRFLVGLGGASFFFYGLWGVNILIALLGINNFIAGLFIGVIIVVDILLIAYLTKCGLSPVLQSRAFKAGGG